MSNNKKIVKNSIFLYIRMIFLTVLTLYTARVMLTQLGIVDYGIYNIVGGIVTMLAFFNSSMSVATQRFMSYDIGKNDLVQLKKTFNSSLLIYFIMGVVIIIILESLGLWYINNKLVFPIEKLHSVNIVYQLSVVTFFINIIQLPYNALVLAHEEMQVYTYISFLDSILKLIILYFLQLGGDKLILYAVLVLLVSVLVQIVYVWYCQSKFEETKIEVVSDMKYLKELSAFSGWNLFGNIASVAKNQGINLVLNLFFGVTLNAAFALTNQVQNAIGSFVTNFQKAINPQIIKNYANEKYSASINLVLLGSRYSFFLTLLIIVPLALHTDFILKMWLVDVPQYTIPFVKYALIVSLIDSLSGSIMTLFQATGRIKLYQLVVGFLVFLNLPFSYLLIKNFNSPNLVFHSMLLISGLSLFARLFLLKNVIDFSLLNYVKQVLVRIFYVIIILFGIGYFFMANIQLSGSIKILVVNILIEEILMLLVIFFIGTTFVERKFLIGVVTQNKVVRFIKRK
ncbi:lipopolysaccharide biosynthesis protein [Sphingobacterium sp. BS-2]|uniref:lipopolysaccharide biosynthesis protein n=1 Tax=Sphingobacterium sp. BS-2 TaxID=3377129 RepID=UPI0038FCCC42